MTEIESQSEPTGNTKTVGKRIKQDIQCYRWQFTLKAIEPIEPKIIYDNLKTHCKEFYYQLEEGKDGYKHYQGCLSLINKHRLQEVKNIIGDSTVHLENAKNWNALKNYCKKKDTYINGPWTHNSVWIETISDLNYWQELVYEKLREKPDPRKVYWIWDTPGGKGKSVFCTYCIIKLGATVLENGAYKDIAYIIPDDPKIILFDFPRTVEGRINYTAIEKCKDGRIMSSKYEGRIKLFNTPHVFVFANFPPDYKAMSMDRWEVICLDD
jgi:hypothetical protein